MVSFDIKSLFTNVPLDEVINICLNQLYNSDLLPTPFPRSVCNDMLCMATKNVQFSFNNLMFRQIDGVAMGSPLGPILANIFVGYYENSLLSLDNSKPLVYYRYVDDVFAIFTSKNNVNKFFTLLNKMHKCIAFTVEEEVSGKIHFLDINITRNSNNTFSTSVYRKENFSPHYISWNSFCPTKQKLKIIQCITNRAIKICTADCLNLEFDNIYKIFLSLGYPETVIKKTIKATQSKMNRLPFFGPHPCPVYLRLPYMGENSIGLAKQASLAIKSTFNSVSLRVVYNTNRPLNGIVKDATPTHDLSNVVYIFKCHCGNDYVGRTSQRFHVRREQHVTKKLKRFIFNDDVKPKGEQSSIHQHLLNNPVCAENYLDNRFEILSRARNTYHLSVLESLFIRSREPKICKQRDFYNLKLYK